jgi:CheY-like chemotaxis protein
MHDLGGDLIVESVHGTGATFISLLPIPDHVTVRNAYLRGRRPMMQSSAPPRRSVLVVDDDERILKAYARVLGRSCNVMMASDGQEAIDLLSSGSTADALVTELSLPDVDGQKLYEWVLREAPELAGKTVFVAAEATRERYKGFLGRISNRVLVKPVTANSLMTALNEAIRPEPTSEGLLHLG